MRFTKYLLIALLLVIFLPLVSAADDANPPMGDNSMDNDSPFGAEGFSVGSAEFNEEDILKPVFDTIQPFLRKLSFLVGGIFGLYLILILARVHYERKKVKLLEAIRYDLDRWNMHHGVTSSRQRKGIFKRIWSFFRHRSYDKEIKKINGKDKKKK
tara:strand:- start:30 stop:497 length:468 start_codon:yes stop_codon:yes gene_type:complete